MTKQFWKTRMPCPVCKDTSGVCEHICQGCDVIVEIGTCTNGYCETCCADQCCEDEEE